MNRTITTFHSSLCCKISNNNSLIAPLLSTSLCLTTTTIQGLISVEGSPEIALTIGLTGLGGLGGLGDLGISKRIIKE